MLERRDLGPAALGRLIAALWVNEARLTEEPRASLAEGARRRVDALALDVVTSGEGGEALLDRLGEALGPAPAEAVSEAAAAWYARARGRDAPRTDAGRVAALSRRLAQGTGFAGGGDEAPDLDDDAPEMLLSDDMSRAYQVERLLGEGAQGQVFAVAIVGDQAFEGYQGPVERAVVKLAKNAAGGEALRQEEAIYAQPDRRVVRSLDAGALQDGRRYLVLEMLQPTPSVRFSGEGARVDPASACEIFVNLLDALKTLHFRRSLPLVLCDLKPENVMLRMAGAAADLSDDEYLERLAEGRYEVVFTDLGVAQQRETLLAAEGRVSALIGSPLYLPPESVPTFAGAEFVPGLYSTKTDVYALTLSFYVMLTGHRPYARRGLYQLSGADQLRELLDFKREGVPPHDRKRIHRDLGSAAPPVLALLDAGLEADPERRATADTLLRIARQELRLEERAQATGDYCYDDPANRLRLRQRHFPPLSAARAFYARGASAT